MRLWTEDLEIVVLPNGWVLVDGREESLIGKWHKCTAAAVFWGYGIGGIEGSCVVCGETYYLGQQFRSKWIEGVQ